MCRVTAVFVLMCFLWGPGNPGNAGDKPVGGDKKAAEAKERKPRFTIGKETTFATEPKDHAGYVDYAAALNARLGKDVKPENNSNVLFWKAWGPRPEGGRGMPPEFFAYMGIPEPPESDDCFVDSHRYLRERLREEPGAAFEDELDKAGSRPWKAKEFPQIASWIKANDVPLRLVREGALRSHYYSPLTPGVSPKEGGLVAVLLPGVQKARSLANALVIRAMLNLGEGRHDEAWADLLTCHRLGRHIARGGTLIEGLVGVAIDNIANGADIRFLDRAKLDAKKALACLRDLQSLPAMPSFADKVDFAERFMMLEIMATVERYGVKNLDGLAGLLGLGAPIPVPAGIIDTLDWNPALRHINNWYDRTSAAMRTENRLEREKKLQALGDELAALKDEFAEPAKLIKFLSDPKISGEKRARKVGDVLISLLLPSVRKVQSAADRTHQVRQNLLTAVALSAFQREHGAFPKKLSELSPKLLSEAPLDIYSGKPLVYRPSKNGFLIYSVGANGKDENGHTFDDDPSGDDWAVRLPIVERKKRDE